MHTEVQAGPQQVDGAPPPNYAKCLAGVITTINSSTTKLCAICKQTPEPIMKSTTTTQI